MGSVIKQAGLLAAVLVVSAAGRAGATTVGVNAPSLFVSRGQAFSTSQTQQTKTLAKRSRSKTASHATTGIVKSIDANTLVITRPGKRSGEMTFQISASTQRDGTIEVGSPVAVRYLEEGQNHIATAITAQHVKQHAAAHSGSRSLDTRRRS